MSRLRVHRPSPALVVSTIALVVALGGTSYAAFGPSKNSVGTKQLKNGAVTNKKVAGSAIGTGKLRNNAVTTAKLANGAVTASKLAGGSVTAAALNLAALGTVPSATNATHATSADVATNATNATNAATATNATNATNATHATSANTATTAGGAPPTGAAGGDLTGTYPNPTIGAGAVTPTKIGTIPQASATSSAPQSITSGSVTDLTLDTNEFDTAGIHSTTTNPDRLTAPIAGIYQVNLSARWQANATGSRFLAIEKNDGGYFASAWVPAAPATDDTDQSVSTLIQLAAGDFVNAVAYQTSGAALSIGNQGGDPSHFSMTWVGKG